MHEPGRDSIRFGAWEIRPRERTLLVHGQPVHIGSRALDVLLVLVAQPGQVVAKDDLLAQAWRGRVVEDNNLTVQVTTLRKLLGAATIVTVPGVGYQLGELPRSDAPPKPPDRPTPTASPGPLMLGRGQEFDALLELLGSAAVVSIVGTGGVGKTTLARAAVARLAGAWRGGSHWIDLAPQPRNAPLLPLIAKALQVSLDGLDPTPQALLSALSDHSTLLVLDNAEHVLETVAGLLEQALTLAPGIRWLVTSQEPLRIGGEAVLRLHPLDLPRAGAPLPEAAASSALVLFCDRARATDHRFTLDPANVEIAGDICRQLDGLPLALEMAAARVASLGLQGVHEQLGRRLRLLVGRRGAPERQMSLGGTFDWSYGLLSEVEQSVFRRLEPFLGGFDVAMAQAMGDLGAGGTAVIDPDQALLALGALVDKSLVQRLSPGGDRLGLLESARDYARQRLEEAGEKAAVDARHARVMAERFRRCDDDLQQLPDADWIARYAPERHNVRAALQWAVAAGDADLLALMVASLASMDFLMETPAEVLRADVPADVLGRAGPSLRALGCLHFGWAHYADGSRERATELLRQALADFEALGDFAGTFRALTLLVRVYRSRPGMAEAEREALLRVQALDDTRAPLRLRLMCSLTTRLQDGEARIARLNEVQAVARGAGLDTLSAMCCAHLTDSLNMLGRYEASAEAAMACMESLQMQPRSRALVSHNHALALVRLGRVREALVPAREALRALPGSAQFIVDVFAVAAAAEGRWADAAMLAGHALHIRNQRHHAPDPAEATAIADTRRQLEAALPKDRLDELFLLGASLSTRSALGIAMPEGDGS